MFLSNLFLLLPAFELQTWDGPLQAVRSVDFIESL